MNVRVVNLFVSLCQIHQEQKTITSHIKMVTKPLQSPEFLSLIEIDLMDFQNTPCDCKNVHTWAMNIIDHHTKFVTVVPLQHKTADEVLKSFREYCYTYGFPKKIITDNGGEFQNKKLKMFCNDNGIELSHGAPRTPTTQGLTERSNLSWKQDMRSLIVSTADKKHQEMVPVHERGLIHQKHLIPPSHQSLPLRSCIRNKTSQGKAK